MLKTRTSHPNDPRPELARGQAVIVASSAPGIREWSGTVLSVKPGAADWWVEVRDADHMTWQVPSHLVRSA